MRRRTLPLRAVALLALLNLATRVDAASILYGTTDLGYGFSQLRDNADGSTFGVQSPGGVTYAFDKSPTAATYNLTFGPGPNDEYQVLTLQNGNYKAGYDANINYKDNQTHLSGNLYFYPSFEPHDTNWFTGGGDVNPVIADLNSQGQVVGKGLIPGMNVNNGNSYFAAFSAVGLLPHGGDAAVTDNLNSYIATVPGMSLISTLSIDDLGRIIAEGSNGHEYLLTPVSLGGVETVPEPTTLATLALGGLLWMAHASRRKYRRV